MEPKDPRDPMYHDQQGLSPQSPSQRGHHHKATRSSLACLPCRSKHLKCDGKQPQCTRCMEFNKECNYAKSRRGGLDRAALTERRRQQAAEKAPSTAESSEMAATDAVVALPHPQTDQEFNASHNFSISPSSLSSRSLTDRDSLLEAYYDHFHTFHPFVLPKQALYCISQSPAYQPYMAPLLDAMRLIGAVYVSKQWPTLLGNSVETLLSESVSTDPFLVQCRLLYSIALFWHREVAKSQVHMAAAVRVALATQLYLEEFSFGADSESPVLQECWRRTWWQLYILDGYYAGTLGSREFRLLNVPATARLPCEETEYESGFIPRGKTLDEFDDRELAPDHVTFSSFAYLIGASRCATTAATCVVDMSAPEASAQVIQVADTAIDSWMLSLPKNRNQLMNKEGELDELMVQAHLLLGVAIVGLHRPLSDLHFHAVESMSSCARSPEADIPESEQVNIHTTRVLRAVEAQIQILALPVRPFSHSPFVTCMLSEGTLALLSACNSLLRDKKLRVARDQIRLTLGCLKAVGEFWPRVAKNVQELQAVARHVLGKNTPSSGREISTTDNTSGDSNSQAQETVPVPYHRDLEHGMMETQNMGCLGGWWGLNEVDMASGWWMQDPVLPINNDL